MKHIPIDDFLNFTLPDLMSTKSVRTDPKYTERKIVAFIGAGISKNYGCRSWNSLAHELLDKCIKINLSGNKGINYLTVDSLKHRELSSKILITIAKNYLGDETFIEFIKEALNHKDTNNDWEPLNTTLTSDIYKHIKACFSYFITTNADRHIDMLCSAKDKNDKENKVFDQIIGNNLEKYKLYKIHGCISNPNEMIFTSNDYLKAYGIKGPISEFLTGVFSRCSAVFIGYSLSEFEIIERLFTVKNNQPHYIIRGYYDHEINLIEAYDSYFGALGITQVVYSMDERGHNALNDAFEKRFYQLENKNIPIEKYDLIDEAFKVTQDE